MPEYKLKFDALRDALWTLTETDWELDASHTLTEPTMAYANIRPEGIMISRYAKWASTIEDAIHLSVNAAYLELVEKKIGTGNPFYSDTDCGKFEKWILDGATLETFPWRIT